MPGLIDEEFREHRLHAENELGAWLLRVKSVRRQQTDLVLVQFRQKVEGFARTARQTALLVTYQYVDFSGTDQLAQLLVSTALVGLV
ncbi:hypothetical protein C6P64_16785 [Malikia granosa]|uniref:Uncharacterized protein n=1 Tax=Malikia granosa TaxID=263067 RepID=A0A2S9K0N9_9BURK|nr:hypothetical protein C6P64_16785 [Malikia granosa]